MSHGIRSSASTVSKVLGGMVLGVLIAFARSVLVFVAVPAGLFTWTVLLPAMLFAQSEKCRAFNSPLYCVKYALLLRDACLGRTLARPMAGTGVNPWPWPWEESPANIRRYGSFTELI